MINIPSSIKSKIDKQNQTIYENANPKMNVAIARPKNTVEDSTYWTVETIRQKEGLGDVSLATRRYKTTGKPNRIYEIHVDNGIVGTSIREYPDKLKDGWQNQFTLGTGSNVAIAFNGHWERYRKLWRLVTDEKPHIMWVDGDSKLQTQHWDDATSKQELATSVLYIRAIRGWKNVNFTDKDQGIIAGYIKTDGTVWYRNYCSQLDGTNTWENERQLTEFTGTAVNLNLFITNDYRMGFIIEDSLGGIYWYITERNWAGMAIGAEYIEVKAKATVNLIPIEYINAYTAEHIEVSAHATADLLFARTDNSLISLENIAMTRLDETEEEYQDWGFKVKFTLNYKTETTPTVTLTDKVTEGNLPVSTVTAITAGYEYEVLVNATALEFGFNIATGDITIQITDAENEAGYEYDTITQDFTPTNLNPPNIGIPELEEVWNE